MLLEQKAARLSEKVDVDGARLRARVARVEVTLVESIYTLEH